MVRCCSARSAHFLRRPYENVQAGSIRPIAKRLEWPDADTVLPKAEQEQRSRKAALEKKKKYLTNFPPGGNIPPVRRRGLKKTASPLLFVRIFLPEFPGPFWRISHRNSRISPQRVDQRRRILCDQSEREVEVMNAVMIIDTFWVLLAAILVFFMNLGFAAVEAGFARS